MDERQRKFERAAVAGDPEALAHLLRERVRAGLLEDGASRVMLAAYLGEPSARLVHGECPACAGKVCMFGEEYRCPPKPGSMGDRDRWVGMPGWEGFEDTRGYGQACFSCGVLRPWPKRLPQTGSWLTCMAHTWPHGVTVRACIALARGAFRIWQDQTTSKCCRESGICALHRRLHTTTRAALETAEDWVAHPDRAPELLAAAREVQSRIGRRSFMDTPDVFSGPAYSIINPPNCGWTLAQAARNAAGLLRTKERSGTEAVRKVIAEELVPWALGAGDPVLVRAASREVVDG